MKRLIPLGTILSLLFTFGCAPKNEFQSPPAPEVTVQKPEQKDITVFQGFAGRLVAHDEVEIRARIKGFLQSVDFEDGQRVEKGDLLFTIEPESYEAAVKSAEAMVMEAQAALDNAKLDLSYTEIRAAMTGRLARRNRRQPDLCPNALLHRVEFLGKIR